MPTCWRTNTQQLYKKAQISFTKVFNISYCHADSGVSIEHVSDLRTNEDCDSGWTCWTLWRLLATDTCKAHRLRMNLQQQVKCFITTTTTGQCVVWLLQRVISSVCSLYICEHKTTHQQHTQSDELVDVAETDFSLWRWWRPKVELIGNWTGPTVM